MSRVSPLSYFSPSIRKIAWLSLCIFVIFGESGERVSAQAAGRISDVKRIAVDWPESGKASAKVRNRVKQKLIASGKLQIVQDVTQADAVLHGSAAIWTTGYILTSPRSKGSKQAIYQGYASAELDGMSGNTLWSYLATPKTIVWKSISEDLGDQLATALLEAIRRGQAGEKTTTAASSGGTGKSPAAEVKLHGGGSTFSAPIYQKWFQSFQGTRPEIQVRYDVVGSGEGIRRIRAGELDFGASDMPLSGEQLQGKEGKLLQFATVLGAVVPIYNVKGVPDGMNLTPEVLAGIYLGKITKWNAPEIRVINRPVRMPDEKIIVVHRSDGSGTTYVWADYLSKVNEEWKSRVGADTTVAWPLGIGADGNQGVAEMVAKTANSIGYVEFIYALQHELSFAAVRSASGEYVKADLDSVTAAGKVAGVQAGNEFQTSITNASGKHTYPIASFTWVLIPAEGSDTKKQAALRELVRWMLTSGQKQCESLGYAPLPGDLAARELQALETAK